MENQYSYIFQKAWEIMCIEFTINGFTISYGKVFVFSLLCILVLKAIFIYLMLKG